MGKPRCGLGTTPYLIIAFSILAEVIQKVIDQAEVWLGEARYVSMMLEDTFSKVLSRTERAKTELIVNWTGPVPAPVSKGQKIGELVIKTDGEVTDILPLLAAVNVRQLGMLDRIGEALKYLIFGAPVQSTASN